MDELEDILGDGWIKEVYGNNGQGWKFIEIEHPDNMIFYHNGGGEHVGSYYGITSGKTGGIKVVNSATYVPTIDDSAYIIYSEDW